MIARAKMVVAIGTAVAAMLSASAWARSTSPSAGYRAGHDAFRSVHASWVMPQISCPGQSSPGYQGSVSVGVGLGASYASSEQVVTRGFCTGTVATYVAYFTVGGVQAVGTAGGLPVNLHPGDRISASVTYLGRFPLHSGSNTYHVGRYRFTLRDATQHRSVRRADSSDCVAHPCGHSTAEVTAGLPFTGYSPLARYGKVHFTGITIVDWSGYRGSFARNRHWKVTRLVEATSAAHHPAATPSALTHRGTRFADTWLAY